LPAELARDVRLDAPLVQLISQRFDAARDALGLRAAITPRRSRPWDTNGPA